MDDRVWEYLMHRAGLDYAERGHDDRH
jgi:hypothetical protein